MRVDEAWHQHVSIRRHDRDISIRVNGNRTHRYAFNDVVSNQHVEGAESIDAVTVEDADVFRMTSDQPPTHQIGGGSAPELLSRSPPDWLDKIHQECVSAQHEAHRFQWYSPSQSESTFTHETCFGLRLQTEENQTHTPIP